MNPRFVACFGLLVGALLLTSCGGEQSGEPLFEELGPPGGQFELSHVHGLGVNPADGLLYIATHSGLYRLESDGPQPVGNRRWDVMGFTVRGPNDFIGGGHPSPSEIRDGKYPPLLGFIRSKDSAESWDILAMKGETDLHALAVSDGIIYAVDATKGELLASTDGRHWETRSRLMASSIAVEADGKILAATTKGLQQSTDQGRTWSPASTGSAFVLVAAQQDVGSWAIDSNGAVYRNGPTGSWISVGRLQSRPEAFSVTNDQLFAATDAGIFQSSDGQAWTELYKTTEGADQSR